MCGQPANFVGDVVCITSAKQVTRHAFLYCRRHAAESRHHHGSSAGISLDDDSRETLIQARGHYQELKLRQRLLTLGLRLLTMQLDARQLMIGLFHGDDLFGFWPATVDMQWHLRQLTPRVQQDIDTFFIFEAANEYRTFLRRVSRCRFLKYEVRLDHDLFGGETGLYVFFSGKIRKGDE